MALIAISAVLAAGVLLELSVRALADVDDDGNVLVLGRRLEPYRPPAERVARLAQRFEGESAFLVYDAATGWSPKPSSMSDDGLYHYDEGGRRVAPAPADPPEDAPRVGLFGDSFVHGDDVPWEASLAGHLEQGFVRAGRPVHVLNFGVPGYGMDQALLRFLEQGRIAELDIVVFGFQSENVNRNVNLVRCLMWWRTGLPFSKPRFVLTDGELELVNRPPVPPESLPDVLRELESWDLLRYESFYDPDDYRERPWSWSRAACLLEKALVPPSRRDWFDPAGEPAQLTLAIVRRFREEVERAGARFVVLHVPKRDDLVLLMAGRPLEYATLVDGLRGIAPWIDPAPRMLAAAQTGSLDGLFVGGARGGHYADSANRIAAEVLAEELLAGADDPGD